MRRSVSPKTKASSIPSKTEGFRPLRLHREKVRPKQQAGSRFKNNIVSLRPITQREPFQQSLALVSQHIEENAIPGQNLEPEKQWILNLKDIVDGKLDWQNDPVAANSYTYAYLAIMTGKIQVDGLNPIDLLTPETGQQRFSLLQAIVKKQNPVQQISNRDIAQEYQTQLENEFQIAQLALLPQEQYYLTQPFQRMKQRRSLRSIRKLLKKGAPYNELLASLRVYSIREKRLETAKRKRNSELREYYSSPQDEVEFRQLIHELTAGSIAEHLSLNLPDGVDSFDQLDVSKAVKKAASPDNLAAIPQRAFDNRETVKALSNTTNPYQHIRSAIHPDLTPVDLPDIDILKDLATINPSFAKKLVDQINQAAGSQLSQDATVEQIKQQLENLTNQQIQALTDGSKDIALTAVKEATWDQPIDLAFTFLERKAEQALATDTIDLSSEHLTQEFFQQLQPKQIAPILAAGLFTPEQLQEKGVEQKSIQTAQDKFIFRRPETDQFEMKIIVPPNEYDHQLQQAANPDNYHDQAMDILVERLEDTSPSVARAYKQAVIENISSSITDSEINQIKAQNFQRLSNLPDSKIKKIIAEQKAELDYFDLEGNPIIDNSDYPMFMEIAKQTVVQQKQTRKLKQLQQELAEKAKQAYQDRHMAQDTADQIDPSYLAALQKIGKLEDQTTNNASAQQKRQIQDFLTNAPQNNLNLPPDYQKYAPLDWSIFFQFFPDIAQQFFRTLTNDKQQQIAQFFT